MPLKLPISIPNWAPQIIKGQTIIWMSGCITLRLLCLADCIVYGIAYFMIPFHAIPFRSVPYRAIQDHTIQYHYRYHCHRLSLWWWHDATYRMQYDTWHATYDAWRVTHDAWRGTHATYCVWCNAVCCTVISCRVTSHQEYTILSCLVSIQF